MTVQSGKTRVLHTAGKYCDKDIVVTATGGGGECSGKHYIEVDELPTENIDEEAVYKCGDSFHKWGKTFEDIILHNGTGEAGIHSLKQAFEADGTSFYLHYAETKPTENILLLEENHIYYIEDENKVCYCVTVEESGEPVWIDLVEEDSEIKFIGAITDVSVLETIPPPGYHALVGRKWENYIPTDGELAIAENGTYDVSGIESVVVETPANAICGQWATTEIMGGAPIYPLGRKWEQQVNFTVLYDDGNKSYTGMVHGNKNFLFFVAEDGTKDEAYIENINTILDFGTEPQVVCADLIALMETYAVCDNLTYNDGYVDGYDIGYIDGYNEGTAEGGYDEGYNAGYEDGSNYGMRVGYDEGYDEGKTEGIAEGYNNGKADGITEGKDNAYNEFWDSYQENGNRTRYRRAFCGSGWAAPGLLKPKYPIVLSAGTSVQEGMFEAFNIYSETMYDMTEICKMIDFSQCTNPIKLFTDAVAKNITCDFSSAVQLNQTFARPNGGNLDYITLKVTENTTFPNTFAWQSFMTTVIFTEDSVIGNSISFADSPLLTSASVDSIINALKDLTGETAQTLTLHVTVKANLTEAQTTAISAKNWLLA